MAVRGVRTCASTLGLLVAAAGLGVVGRSTIADTVVEGPAAADIANEPPYGPGAEVGESYDYVLYVHCGVEWARLDGVWWQTERLGNANPPSSWGNPYDKGRMYLLDTDNAEYDGPDGPVLFQRTDLVEPPFACL